MSKKPDIAEVIQALAAGCSVDWNDVEDAGEESTRAILRGLEIVSRIAKVHGTLGAPASGSPALPRQGDDASAISSPLSATFRSWGPLIILERVGKGSYGDVWRAWDTRLDREVALKLLHDAPSGDDAAAVEEGRLLARVQHPNVVTVYGADRIDSRVGIWMEFLEGRTLEQLLQEHGPFGGREAALIGADVCRGLAAVHQAGLVHGDIKGNNVMREDDGRIALMDFGASGHIRQDSGGRVTGTPLYIAPEVLEGSASTPRSDVYSVGVLLYHLTTGTYPVTGTTLRDVRDAHRRQQRRHLAEVRADLPERFVAVIEHALAADAGQRLETAVAFGAALSRAVETASTSPAATRKRNVVWGLAAASLLVAALIGGTALWTRNATTSAQRRLGFEPRDTVLITKFENRTGEAVLDGAVESALQRGLNDSDVINLASDESVGDALQMMKRPAGTVIDRVVGREVALRDGRIKVLLAGRIERFGSKYQITAQLIDPADNSVVATIGEEADGQEAVLAALKRQAARVRAALGESLERIRGADPNVEPAATSSLLAFQLHDQSYQLGRQGKWDAALKIAQRMVTVDPEFASGWIWLAWAVRNTERPGWIQPDDPVIAKYREFAERALRLAEHVPEWERHWITGSYYTLTGQPARSIPHYDALLRLKPGHFYALNNVINARVRLHRPEDYPELLKLRQMAGDQRPNDPAILAMASIAAVYETGTVLEAKPYLDRLRELAQSPEPIGSNARFRYDFAQAYILLHVGDLPGTLEQAHRIAADFRRYPARLRLESITGIHQYYVALGRTRDWKRFTDSLTDPLDKEKAERSLADAPALRKMLAPYSSQRPPNQYWHGPAFVRAGLREQAWQYIARKTPIDDEGYALIARGQLRLLDGNAQLALPDLERGVELTSSLNNPAYWWGCESLSDALWNLGRQADALTALEKCSKNDFNAVWGPLAKSKEGQSLELHLADLYRRVGLVAKAQEIEGRLRARLALADEDFPLLQELRKRN